MTTNEKRESFMKDLINLLAKYDAQIELEDFGHDYSRDEKIVVNFDYDYQLADGGIIEPIIIGSYLSKEG